MPEGFTFDIATPMKALVTSAVDIGQDAAPIILGAIAAFAALAIGLKLAKRFMSKVG